MKEVERTFKVVTKEGQKEGELMVETRILQLMTGAEAMAEVQKLESNMAQTAKQIKDVKKYIQNEGWIEQLAEAEKRYSLVEKAREMYDEMSKKYQDETREKAIPKIQSLKTKEKYDRMPEGDKKVHTRVQIMNTVREELGIEDMANPIIRKLHLEFDEL